MTLCGKEYTKKIPLLPGKARPTIDPETSKLLAAAGLSWQEKIALRGWLLLVPDAVTAEMLGIEAGQLASLQRGAIEKVQGNKRART